MNPKICLLFAGGTIGMVPDAATGALKPAQDIKAILDVLPEIRKEIDIEVEYLFNLDSSNMQPSHWEQIAQKIQKLYDQYDGFVVAQGTDTMAYTASALSFILKNLGKPVVLTGGMMPLAELGSDARSNLTYALLVATMDFGEVMIVFGSKIMRGNRCSKYMESFTNAFHTPNFPLIGEIYRPIRLFDWRFARNSQKKLSLKTGFNNNIAVIKLFPGYNPGRIKSHLAHDIDGVIMEAFGPGNIPFLENSLLPFLKQAQEQKIPVVICSQMEHGTVDLDSYECGQKARDLNVISGGDMTTECATVKLMWTLGQTDDFAEAKKMMEGNLRGEKTEE